VEQQPEQPQAEPVAEPEAGVPETPADAPAPAPAATPEAPDAEQPDYLALAQRVQADFDNFRKRVTRDLGSAEQRGIAKTVRELLPALDHLEHALASVAADDQLGEGIRLVQAELHAALARVGVEGYSPKGEAFDPNVHEAMLQQPVEGAESGTVVEVYQQGYRVNGQVIRPARVVVAA
jgi:molecular chaperone GrpE